MANAPLTTIAPGLLRRWLAYLANGDLPPLPRLPASLRRAWRPRAPRPVLPRFRRLLSAVPE